MVEATDVEGRAARRQGLRLFGGLARLGAQALVQQADHRVFLKHQWISHFSMIVWASARVVSTRSAMATPPRQLPTRCNPGQRASAWAMRARRSPCAMSYCG